MILLYTHLSTVLKCNCICVHVLKFLFHTSIAVEWGRKRDRFNFSQARGSIELSLAAVTVGFSDTDLHIFLIWKWPESVSFPSSEGISQPDVKRESTSWCGVTGRKNQRTAPSVLFLLYTANTSHGPGKPYHTFSLSSRNCLRRQIGREEGSLKYNSLILLYWLKSQFISAEESLADFENA